MNDSIWHEGLKENNFEEQTKDIKTDVLIIGGGITGILCAYMLKCAGVDHLLVEADRIGRGITENTTAKITSQHGLIYSRIIKDFGTMKASLYYKANQDAIKSFEKLCKDIDCDFVIKDSYVYSKNDRAKIEAEMSALDKLGAKAELCESVPLPFPIAGAVKFPDQAEFNPLKFLHRISEGLNIRESTKVTEFLPDSVLTNRGRIKADKVIIATHFPIINKHGGYFLKLYQHRSYVIALRNAPNLNGMYVDDDAKGLSFRNYKDLLLLGGGSHRTGKKGSGWAELTEFAQKHYPNSKEICRWATQDCMSLDSIPYIGQYSKNTPKLYVATGYNKWGMTSSMVAANVLCDMVTEKENVYSELFSPSRRILRPQLGLNALESVLNLLTPTRPRCPHMGCALKYNKYEHSWDCPCHGSRFTEAGEVINNPATDDKRGKLPHP